MSSYDSRKVGCHACRGNYNLSTARFRLLNVGSSGLREWCMRRSPSLGLRLTWRPPRPAALVVMREYASASSCLAHFGGGKMRQTPCVLSLAKIINKKILFILPLTFVRDLNGGGFNPERNRRARVPPTSLETASMNTQNAPLPEILLTSQPCITIISRMKIICSIEVCTRYNNRM